MDLNSSDGRHIDRLRRNRWTFNDRERFNFAANARGVCLVDTKTNQMGLEARVADGDSVVVTQDAFHSSAGHQIEITTEDWEGAADSRASTESVIQPTNPPSAADEIAAIRKAVVSTQNTIECPAGSVALGTRVAPCMRNDPSFGSSGMGRVQPTGQP